MRVVFMGDKPGRTTDDLTVGKEYEVEFDEDDDAYVIDDSGEQNFAVGSDGGHGLWQIADGQNT